MAATAAPTETRISVLVLNPSSFGGSLGGLFVLVLVLVFELFGEALSFESVDSVELLEGGGGESV